MAISRYLPPVSLSLMSVAGARPRGQHCQSGQLIRENQYWVTTWQLIRSLRKSSFSAFVTPREKEEWHISSDLYCDMGNGFTDSYNAIIVMLVLKVKSMYISYLFHWSIQYFSLQKIRTSFTWWVVLISA